MLVVEDYKIVLWGNWGSSQQQLGCQQLNMNGSMYLFLDTIQVLYLPTLSPSDIFSGLCITSQSDISALWRVKRSGLFNSRFCMDQTKKCTMVSFRKMLNLSNLSWPALAHYVPVNSKTAHPPPPGQSPGIWLTLSSVQWGIWPKIRPARWGIWLSYQNVCQRSETKGFHNSLIQQLSRIHGSLLLSIPRGFFCCCRFI